MLLTKNNAGAAMDLQQLRYFVAVAEVENISLAAHRLRVAQSAVSRQIRLLEQELDSALVERVGRGIKLTDAGAMLRHRAVDLLRQADELRSELRNRGRAPTGVLRVGANPSVGEAMFPMLAKRYTEAYPKVRLHLVSELTMHIQEAVRRGTLDCGIVAFPDRDPSIAVQALADERIFLISHREHDLDWGAVCTVKELANVPLLLPGLPHRERLGYERLAAAKGQTLQCRMEADSLSILFDLARLGLGHLLLPATAVRKLTHDGEWTARSISGFQLQRFLIWQAERPVTEAMDGFRRILNQEVAVLTREGVLR